MKRRVKATGYCFHCTSMTNTYVLNSPLLCDTCRDELIINLWKNMQKKTIKRVGKK